MKNRNCIGFVDTTVEQLDDIARADCVAVTMGDTCNVSPAAESSVIELQPELYLLDDRLKDDPVAAVDITQQYNETALARDPDDVAASMAVAMPASEPIAVPERTGKPG